MRTIHLVVAMLSAVPLIGCVAGSEHTGRASSEQIVSEGDQLKVEGDGDVSSVDEKQSSKDVKPKKGSKNHTSKASSVDNKKAKRKMDRKPGKKQESARYSDSLYSKYDQKLFNSYGQRISTERTPLNAVIPEDKKERIIINAPDWVLLKAIVVPSFADSDAPVAPFNLPVYASFRINSESAFVKSKDEYVLTITDVLTGGVWQGQVVDRPSGDEYVDHYSNEVTLDLKDYVFEGVLNFNAREYVEIPNSPSRVRLRLSKGSVVSNELEVELKKAP